MHLISHILTRSGQAIPLDMDHNQLVQLREPAQLIFADATPPRHVPAGALIYCEAQRVGTPNAFQVRVILPSIQSAGRSGPGTQFARIRSRMANSS